MQRAQADQFHAEAARKYFEGDKGQAEELYRKVLQFVSDDSTMQ